MYKAGIRYSVWIRPISQIPLTQPNVFYGQAMKATVLKLVAKAIDLDDDFDIEDLYLHYFPSLMAKISSIYFNEYDTQIVLSPRFQQS